MSSIKNLMKKNQNSNLSVQVLQKLDKDYLSEPLRNELMQVNGSLGEAMEANFKYHIALDCVRSFQDKKVCSETEKKEQDILANPLYLNLMKKYLPSNSADGIELFGVNADLVDKVTNKKKKSEFEKQELNKFVEKEIDEFCDKITEYSGCAQRYRINKRRAFQESVKDLSSEISTLAVNESKIASDKEEIQEQLLNYYKNLVQGISTFKKLILLYQKKLEFEFLLESLYLTKSDTLAAKLRKFEYQILTATYNKRSIEALMKIREEIDTKKTKLDYEINKTETGLQAYSVLGPTYESLVDHYCELCKNIQHQIWTNDALKQKKSQSESISRQNSTNKKTANSKALESVNSSDPTVKRSMLVETAESSKLDLTKNSSVLKEKGDSSVLVDKMDNSILEQALDSSKLEETRRSCKVDACLDESQLEEILDFPELEETGRSCRIDVTLDESHLEETMDFPKLEETEITCMVDATFDDSQLEEASNNSKLEKIGLKCRFEKSLNDSQLEMTMDFPMLVETEPSCMVEKSLDDSQLEVALNNSKLEQTGLSCRVDATLDNSQLERTMDFSKLEEIELSCMVDQSLDESQLCTELI